jgi:hypothetical protein
MPNTIPAIEPAIQTAVLNAERHWYEDGLSQLLGGLTCTLGTFTILAAHAAPRNGLLAFLQIAFFWASIGFRLRVLRWLKARIAYPRTGYVPVPPSEHMPGSWTIPVATPAEREFIKSHRYSESTWFPLLLFALMMLCVFSRSYAALLAVCGVLAVVATVEGRSPKISWRRAAVGCALGIVAALLPGDVIHRMCAFLLGIGIVASADGAYKLKLFLQRNPRLTTPQT